MSLKYVLQAAGLVLTNIVILSIVIFVLKNKAKAVIQIGNNKVSISKDISEVLKIKTSEIKSLVFKIKSLKEEIMIIQMTYVDRKFTIMISNMIEDILKTFKLETGGSEHKRFMKMYKLLFYTGKDILRLVFKKNHLTYFKISDDLTIEESNKRKKEWDNKVKEICDFLYEKMKAELITDWGNYEIAIDQDDFLTKVGPYLLETQITTITEIMNYAKEKAVEYTVKIDDCYRRIEELIE